jgi:hypothetical protein
MTDFDPTSVKLGLKPGVVHDPRTFRLSALMAPEGELPTPPETSRIAAKVTEFPVFGNDRIGDCTYASHGSRIVAQEYSAGQDKKKIDLTEQQIIEAYSKGTGYNPADPSTDRGGYVLDALNYARTVGIGRDNNGKPHKIRAFAKLDDIDMHDLYQPGTPVARATHIKRAIWQFGGVICGAALPVSAGKQMAEGKRWERTFNYPDYLPWSWGGHAMYVIGYDELGPEFITWGRPQKATWEWWAFYVNESYVVITSDYLRPGEGARKTPRGFSIATLEAALARVTKA